MDWKNTLTELQMILAGIYQIDDDVKRLATQSGVPTAKIDFNGRAIDSWHSLLTEASLHNKLPSLFKIIRDEYPENLDLLNAIRACEDDQAEKSQIAVKVFEFVNRQQELDSTWYSTWPHFALDGPAGFGKTCLMQELQKRFRNSGYQAGYVSVRGVRSIQEMVIDLCKDLSLDTSLAEDTTDPEILGNKVGTALATPYSSRDTTPTGNLGGVVLLLDDVDNAGNLVQSIFKDFIPAVYDVLDNLQFFDEPLRFRLIFAGRYISRLIKDMRPQILLHTLVLKPFDFDVIHLSARYYLKGVKRESLEQLAALTMYLTGGHPKCVAQVFKLYNESPISLRKFAEQKSDSIEKYVHNELEIIWNQIPSDLHKIFKAISFYRFFNVKTLERLANLNAQNAIRLIDRLLDTHLIDKKRYGYSDDITRRLIVLNQRQELDEEIFKEHCKKAFDFYLNVLEAESVHNRDLWAVECLFQHIQGYSTSIQIPATRNKVRNELYDEGAGKCGEVLNVVLKAYVSRVEDYKEDIDTLIFDMDNDWEFQFTANYYLREAEYSPEPYPALRKIICQWRRE